MTGRAFQFLIAVAAAEQRDRAIRTFSNIAVAAAEHRPAWWRWTVHLAAALALRKNGVA